MEPLKDTKCISTMRSDDEPLLMKSKLRVQKHGEVFTPQWVVIPIREWRYENRRVPSRWNRLAISGVNSRALSDNTAEYNHAHKKHLQRR